MITLTGIRHGKAPQVQGQGDLERQLGQVGHEQAVARRKAMGNPKFNLVLSSIAGRAVDTGSVLANVGYGQIIKLPELYPDTDSDMGAEMDTFFRREDLGYAPVARYLDAGAHVVMEHARKAWQAVFDAQVEWGDDHILVVGHAVCLPAMGMAACGENIEGRELLAGANLGECEGFRITFRDYRTVEKVELIQ